MKTVGTILKILAALAAIAGIIYVIATYGDKIVAWAKKLLSRCPCCCDRRGFGRRRGICGRRAG